MPANIEWDITWMPWENGIEVAKEHWRDKTLYRHWCKKVGHEPLITGITSGNVKVLWAYHLKTLYCTNIMKLCITHLRVTHNFPKTFVVVQNWVTVCKWAYGFLHFQTGCLWSEWQEPFVHQQNIKIGWKGCSSLSSSWNLCDISFHVWWTSNDPNVHLIKSTFFESSRQSVLYCTLSELWASLQIKRLSGLITCHIVCS